MSLFLNFAIDIMDERVPRSLKTLIRRQFPAFHQVYYRSLRRVGSLEPVEIAIRRGPLRGRKFRCALKNERDYWIGNHEPVVARLLTLLLGPGAVFYDVGVHKGYFSLLAAERVGTTGLVVGFEPNPHNAREVRENLTLNPDLASRVRLEEMAVSDAAGTVIFCGEAGAATGHMSGQIAADAPNRYRVDTISIDEYIAAGYPQPTLIKMDIEGGEALALRGLRGALRAGSALIVEIHTPEAAVSLAGLLGEIGGRCVDLADGRPFTTPADFEHREQFAVFPASRPMPDLASILDA